MEYNYSAKREPTILSKVLLDFLYEQENPFELIALYTFYYYTAKWQDTKIPKAVNSYVMQKSGWGRVKFYKHKRKLTELGLIKNITRKDNDGKFSGEYIYVEVIISKEDLVNVLSENILDNKRLRTKSTGMSIADITEQSTGMSKNGTPVKLHTNTLKNNNNINTLKTRVKKRKEKNSTKKEKNPKLFPDAEVKLNNAVRTNKNKNEFVQLAYVLYEYWSDNSDVKPSTIGNIAYYLLLTFDKLNIKDDAEKLNTLKKMVNYIVKFSKTQYAPQITNEKEFLNKSHAILAAIKRDKRDAVHNPDYKTDTSYVQYIEI